MSPTGTEGQHGHRVNNADLVRQLDIEQDSKEHSIHDNYNNNNSIHHHHQQYTHSYHHHNNHQHKLHDESTNNQQQNDSSIDSSKMNSPEILSSLPSLTALTTAMSLPGQSEYLDYHNSKIHTESTKDTSANILNSTASSSSADIPLEFKPYDDSGSHSKMNLIIICVGLPARGKSYITKKLQKYLNWMQYETKIFNVGNTRRQEHTGPSDYPVQGPTNYTSHSSTSHNNIEGTSTSTNSTSHDASFFDHSNPETFHKREQWAIETLNQVIDYVMSGEGNVGIFDATNTTKARRKWIIQSITSRTKGAVKVMFLESICTDQTLIEKNIRLKLSGPDYREMDQNLALEDFKNRLHNYEKVYETIDDEEEKENEKYDIQYLKIINAGKKIVSYNINGYLASHTVFFLLNFNLSDRQIWLTVNGETEDSLKGIKGGDAKLNKKGEQFARALPKFIGKKRQEFKLRKLNQEYINDLFFDHHDSQTANGGNSSAKLESEYNIWTSTLQRTIDTVTYFPNDEYQLKTFRMLNDLGCGLIDGLSDQQFRQRYPDDYANLLKNKLSFRFPGLGGESYLDVISRVRPMIIELERLKEHVLIVSHRVITRVLLGYFMNLSKEMLTELDVQHGYVYCIEPKPYGLHLKIYNFDEFTDDFYEVDEIEFMKKKRHRGSMSISTNNKGKVVLNEKPSDNAVASSSEESSTSSSSSSSSEYSSDEYEEDDDHYHPLSSSSTYISAQPFERTVSQSFEFRADSGSSTPVRLELDQSIMNNNNGNTSPLKMHKNRSFNNSSSSSAVFSMDKAPSLEDLNLRFTRPSFLIQKAKAAGGVEDAGHDNTIIGGNKKNKNKKKRHHNHRKTKSLGTNGEPSSAKFDNGDDRKAFLDSLKLASPREEIDIDAEVSRILEDDELVARIKKALGFE